MNLTTEKFEKIMEKYFGHGGCNNWNKLSDYERFAGTQKEMAKYRTVEEFKKIINELRANIFN